MKRGRKSAAALAITPTGTTQRLAPVEGMTADECDLWVETVNRLPADFFAPEQAELLAGYVRHAIAARDLSRLIHDFNPEWIKPEGGLERLDRMLKMRRAETAQALACARALRITNQARMHPRTAGRAADNAPASGARPWDGSEYLGEGKGGK